MSSTDLMAEIASDEILKQAYRWLCVRRRDYSSNNDVWTLRWRWREVKPQVQKALLSGTYRFAALVRLVGGEGTLEVWSSQDTLVLKDVAIVLGIPTRPLSVASAEGSTSSATAFQRRGLSALPNRQ
jgi:RNA-directed DNA polymerase